MGLWGWIVGIGVAGLAVHAIKKSRRRTKKLAKAKVERDRRRDTPCRFTDGFSEEEFEQMVRKAGKSIKRLSKITVDGPIVYGVVQSQSGISEWNFKLDFNDYGHITGTYWMSSDNDDSNIPERFGDLICEAIKNYSPDDGSEEDEDGTDYSFTSKTKTICPYCGKQQTVDIALYCVYCGKKLR